MRTIHPKFVMRSARANDDEDDDEELTMRVDSHEETVIIENDRIANIYIQGPICEEVVAPAIEYIIQCSMDHEKQLIGINMFIDSTGGELDAAMKLIDAMRMSEVGIRTIGWGKVASAALMIFMAGGERVMSENVSVMSHHASFNATAYSIRVTDPSQQMEFKLITDRIVRIYQRAILKDRKYIMKHLLKDHDVYLSAEQCIEHGIAHYIMPRGMGWLKTFEVEEV